MVQSFKFSDAHLDTHHPTLPPKVNVNNLLFGNQKYAIAGTNSTNGGNIDKMLVMKDNKLATIDKPSL